MSLSTQVLVDFVLGTATSMVTTFAIKGMAGGCGPTCRVLPRY
jgi:hypothetical protein